MMTGGFSIWTWVIILVVVLLVFGTKKLANLGGDLGSAVKGFKEGIKSKEDQDKEKVKLENEKNNYTIDGEVKKEETNK